MAATKKLKPPNAKNAPKTADGKVDWDQAKIVAYTMMDQIAAGHYTMDAGSQVDSATDQAGEKELNAAIKALKSHQVLVWFVRGDVNPSDPGTAVGGA